MANPNNTAAVKELTARFQNASSAILTEYRGLSVTEMTELRKELGAEVEYSVAKNTMIKLAAREAGVEGLDEELLNGPTAIAFVNGEAVDAAKAMKKFGADHDAFVVKGGTMDGSALTAEQIQQLADMDNRETTLSKIAGGFNGVLANVASLLGAPHSEMARLAAALEEKK